MTGKKSGIGTVAAVIVIILVLVLLIGSCGGSGSGGGATRKNTCKSCGRSYEAGDAGGNFMNIARTGMCKNCYNNYQWAQKAAGK